MWAVRKRSSIRSAAQEKGSVGWKAPRVRDGKVVSELSG